MRQFILMDPEPPAQSPPAQPVDPLPPARPPSKPPVSPMLLLLGLLLLILGVAGGVVLGKQVYGPEQSSPGIPVVSPTPLVTRPDDVAWKTYENKDLGISFQYPSGWVVGAQQLLGSGSLVEIKDPTGVYTLIFQNRGNYNTGTGKAYATLDEFLALPYQVNHRVVGGQDAALILPRAGTTNFAVHLFSPDAKFIYTIELGTPKDDLHTNEGQKIFDQVLSSFKFLEKQEKSEELLTYKDQNYPFEIQYPKDWALRTTYGKSVGNVGNDRIAGIDLSNNLTYGSTVVINVIDPNNNTFSQWMKLYSGKSNVPDAPNSTYLGVQSYRFEFPREGRPSLIEIYYQYKDKIIFIAQNVASISDQPTVDSMLSTLKFTN